MNIWQRIKWWIYEKLREDFTPAFTISKLGDYCFAVNPDYRVVFMSKDDDAKTIQDAIDSLSGGTIKFKIGTFKLLDGLKIGEEINMEQLENEGWKEMGDIIKEKEE